MSAKRYDAVAIVLHWAIAIAIVGMIALGWWMTGAISADATKAQAVAAYQLHKSIGLSILALSLLRLGWRFLHPPPPLPAGMARWERFAAKATHWAFYLLLIILPLSGWIYVSAGWSPHEGRALEVPTLYFGMLEVPHLFGLRHASEAARSTTAANALAAHQTLVLLMLALMLLHVAAALKHHFLDRDEVLAHMVPGLKSPKDSTRPPTSIKRRIILGFGFALIAVATGAAVWRFLHPPASATNISARANTGIESVVTPGEPGAPPAWRVDPLESAINFSGADSGTPFEGKFSRWRAEIRFDANRLADSYARIIVETASASDGIMLHDQTLPQQEWFDTAAHPEAVFETTEITRVSENAYEAKGTLTIKDKPIALALPFTLHIDGGRATMDAGAVLDRREANLGLVSDPEGSWVSREITVNIHVTATK